VCRSTTEIGQKLTDQAFQLNGNEHHIRARGRRCFDDSGVPAVHGRHVVGDTSYGYTDKLPLGGYQRLDNPVVHDWLLDCAADLSSPTKE